MVFSPDGTLLATIDNGDNTGRLWDPHTRQPVDELPVGNWALSVRAAVFSPDSTLLATTDSDKTVRLWNIGRDGG